MLNIEKKTNGTVIAFSLEGRLDTTTAPELEAELKGSLEGATSLTLDLEKHILCRSSRLAGSAEDYESAG